MKTIAQAQVTTFKKSQLNQVLTAIKFSEPDRTLLPFKDLSKKIENVTGLLPEKYTPTLQKLAASYSAVSYTMGVSLADLSVTLSKFVDRSWNTIKHGKKKRDKDYLMNLRKQLNTSFINELAIFVNSTKFALSDIHAELSNTKVGNGATDWSNKKKTLEETLLRLFERIKNDSSQCIENERRIDMIKARQIDQIEAEGDIDTTKLYLKQEIENLEKQVPKYKQRLQESRDICREEKRCSFLFCKSERVCQDNGQRIAQELLDRLLQRIRDRKERLENYSSISTVEPTNNDTKILQFYEEKKTKLEKRIEELNKQFNLTKEEIDAVNRKLHQTDQSMGTVSVKSIESVAELSHSVGNGSEALIKAGDKIRIHLVNLRQNSDELIDAVLHAIKLLNIADGYNNVTTMKDIAQKNKLL